MKKIIQYIIIVMTLFINSYVLAQDVGITPEKLNIGIGVSAKIKANFNDEDNSFIWSSSNPTIATVNNGIVTGKSLGETYITVTNKHNQKITAIVNVIENFVPISSIKVSKLEEEMLIDKKENLNISIFPENASNKTLIFTSSNPEIANVNSKGIITGKSLGEAYITISDPCSNFKTVVLVSVVNKIKLKSITIPKGIKLMEKSSQKINVSFSPQNATDKKITWKSSNPRIATVNNGTINGLVPGSVTISAISNDGGIVANCQVQVLAKIKPKPPAPIPKPPAPIPKPPAVQPENNLIELKSLDLNKKELTLKVGEKEKLTVKYTPENFPNKKIEWQTSDNQIATIKDGEITALKPGVVEIKAISNEGKKEDNCIVKIIENNSVEEGSVKFSKKQFMFYNNTETPLKSILIPKESNLNEMEITVISDNPQVAAIVEDKIKTNLLGTTNISLVTREGEKISTATIKVIDKPNANLEIKIKGYDLNFSPDKTNYNLKIGHEKQLVFDINKSSKYITINGNENLKNGSIITIIIKDITEKKYTINIEKPGNYTMYFIIAISILLLINIVRMILKNKNNK